MREPAAEGHLLVVDDNEMNRDMLQRRLTRRGYVVDAAEDGPRALRMIRDQGYDLILLDIMMPGMSGVEVLERIRESHSVADLPVVMATAKIESEQIVEALKLGANDYVTKPLDFPVVLARVQTQLEMLRLRRELARLLRVKEEFLAIASHDLKNPLNAVMGFAVLIKTLLPVGSEMTEEGHELAARIVNAAGVMTKIITDFLDFQALEDGEFTLKRSEVDLSELARETIDANAEYAARKDVHFAFEPDESLAPISADRPRIAQVLQNLVGNAIKFCPEGAAVTVRTAGDDSSQVCEVRDTGPGLTDEDLGKIFQKYARLSNQPTGGEKSSGLGLAICKRMIELHGGEIGVRNNAPDRGATFWIRLPVGTG